MMNSLHKLFESRVLRTIGILFSAFFALLYLTPVSVNGLCITAVLVFIMFLVVLNANPGRCALKKKDILILVLIQILFNVMFYIRWSPSSKVAMLAGLLHIPKALLLVMTIVGLGVLSSPIFALTLISLKSVFQKTEDVSTDINEKYNHRNYKVLAMVVLTAIGMITICSKSSPLYPFNDWVDANCFFTVGKSMMNGLVVYRDLFEQKGPFLYFIHGIAWLISNNTFWGVYVIEILAAFVFLYFSYKTVALLWENASIMAIPVIGFLVYTSTAFSHGDSAEELCLPFVAYAIWMSVKVIKQKKHISFVQYFIIGICSGCVFWTKFTLVGFYIGWFLLPAYYLVKEKRWKRLGQAVFAVAMGVLVATIPYIIYFGVNDAIGDWLKVYIWDNIFLYSSNSQEAVAGGLLYNLLLGTECVLVYNVSAFYLGAAGLVLWLSRNDRNVVIHFIFMIICTHFFVYMGGVFFPYYAFIISVFIPFGVAAIGRILSYCFARIDLSVRKSVLEYGSMALCLLLAIIFTPNRYMMGTDQSELPQYQFKEIIEQVENPTLLNYGFLDGGFYTVCDIIPNCKAFCQLNIPLKEMYELQNRYVEEGLCDFVVTCNELLCSQNYRCVAECEWFFEGAVWEYRLYQKC